MNVPRTQSRTSPDLTYTVCIPSESKKNQRSNIRELTALPIHTQTHLLIESLHVTPSPPFPHPPPPLLITPLHLKSLHLKYLHPSTHTLPQPNLNLNTQNPTATARKSTHYYNHHLNPPSHGIQLQLPSLRTLPHPHPRMRNLLHAARGARSRQSRKRVSQRRG